MTTEAQTILESFDSLPDAEKREVASEIVRRTLQSDFPPLSDEELVAIAEETFLELDRGEAEDG